MSLEKNRKIFEKWLKKTKPNLKDPFVVSSRGNYSTRSTQIRFEAFVAGMSSEKTKVLQKQRELFEKWMKSEKPNLKNPFEISSRGNYSTRTTQIRFESFLAGLNS